MFTKIDICTMALLKLGESPIQSLTDDSAAARLARTLFDTTVDTLIAMHPWRFATRAIDLTRTADGDFQIPADVLRVIKCPGEIRGNKICASGEKITIIALVRVAPKFFPGYFASLCAARLAIEFCMPLVGDATMLRTMIALYESELQSAKYVDSSSSASNAVENFSLIDARF